MELAGYHFRSGVQCPDCADDDRYGSAETCPHAGPNHEMHLSIELANPPRGGPRTVTGVYTGYATGLSGYQFYYFQHTGTGTGTGTGNGGPPYRLTLVSNCHETDRNGNRAERLSGVYADVQTTDGRHETLASMEAVDPNSAEITVSD